MTINEIILYIYILTSFCSVSDGLNFAWNLKMAAEENDAAGD